MAPIKGPIASDPKNIFDHFLAYPLISELDVNAPNALLKDQFNPRGVNYNIQNLFAFSDPANKQNEGVIHPDAFLNWYRISKLKPDEEPLREIEYQNQFTNGIETLRTKQPLFLFVPTLVKSPSIPGSIPVELGHFIAYFAFGKPVNIEVTVKDQFVDRKVLVFRPVLFCTPAEKQLEGKDNEPIPNPINHLTVYLISIPPEGTVTPELNVEDQFGPTKFPVVGPLALCVPTMKKGFKDLTRDPVIEEEMQGAVDSFMRDMRRRR